MMKSFRQEIDSAISTRPTTVPQIFEIPSALTIKNIRTFHQNIMVGLIETSKGIRDLYQENKAYKVFIPSDQEGEGYTLSLAAAYDELQAMLGIVIPDYTQCILKPLREFFAHFDRIMLLHESGQLHTTTSNETNSNQGHDIIPSLEEERTIWIALTRQIILDCQYLDSGTEACRPPECDPSLPHADGVAESILNTLDQHFDSLFDKKLALIRESISHVVPEFVTNSDCHAVRVFFVNFLISNSFRNWLQNLKVMKLPQQDLFSSPEFNINLIQFLRN